MPRTYDVGIGDLVHDVDGVGDQRHEDAADDDDGDDGGVHVEK